MEEFNSLILKYNDKQDCNIGWIASKSSIAGNGIMATKKFNPGEVIFVDKPLITGPRSIPNQELLCVGCYTDENLRPCGKCSLYVCSLKCENSEEHSFECEYLRRMNFNEENVGEKLFRILSPLRCLQFNNFKTKIIHYLHKINGPFQGLEVQLLKRLTESPLLPDDESFMQTCCKVLDANAYEIQLPHKLNSIRGLYPMASVMNHSCIPNTTHDFSKEFNMIIKASKEICCGEELTSTYAPLLLGTSARRHFLKQSKHFDCRCSRCQDPTECRTFLSALKCRSYQCHGFLLPVVPLKIHTKWKCQTCNFKLTPDKIAIIQNAIAQEISRLDLRSPAEIIQFVNNHRIVATKHHTIIQFKFILLKLIGYSNGYKWSELSQELLHLKRNICMEIIEIVEKLSLGLCTIYGVCLFELQETDKELKIRNQKNEI